MSRESATQLFTDELPRARRVPAEEYMNMRRLGRDEGGVKLQLRHA